MISRSQMNRQLYQTGGIMGVARENYGFGSKFKKFVRNIIPNEIADIAVKAAPFVAAIPGYGPAAAGIMRGVGRFDQRGSISDALKQGVGTYALGELGQGVAKGMGMEAYKNPTNFSTFVDNPLGTLSESFDTLTENITLDDFSPKNLGEKAGKIIQNVLNQDSNATKTLVEKTNTLEGLSALMKGTAYLLGTGLSYLDQQRINELREEIQRKFEAAQAAKRGQYTPSASSTPAPKASFTAADVVRAPAAYGGRMNYAYGNSVQDGIMAAPQIANQMGMPVGNPRQNQQGIAELDYRDQGGFVPPIGIKEKEDDIPAMLSNNEFVFTADAVRNAGDGDVNEGARKMYTMMKQLENGGMV